MSLHTVIMSGGSGTRLWPLSRSKFPKQFHPLVGDETMVQQTASRLKGLKDLGGTIVVANEDHRFLVAEQLKHLDDLNIILEPCARNTAPAVALAAFELQEQDPESLMLVLSADHVILNEDAFRASVEEARESAQEGNIITFGIVPTYPATGYGYIKVGKEQSHDIFKVDRFVEKPQESVAKAYLSTGQYLWNSGMFIIRSDVYLRELQNYEPEVYEACEKAMRTAQKDPDFIRPNKVEFESCPKISIDYAVMEKSKFVNVTPLDADWSDVGSWSELAKVIPVDQIGNSAIGDVHFQNSRNSYVRSTNKFIALAGVDDLVVVETSDAILIAGKHADKDVKEVVNFLHEQGRKEADEF